MTTKVHFLVMCFLAATSSLLAIGFHDDFGHGQSAWQAGPGWSIRDGGNGNQVYRADFQGDSFSWNTNFLWDASWTVEFDLKFYDHYDPLPEGVKQGAGSLAFSAINTHPGVQFIINLVHNSQGGLYVEIAYFDGTWHYLKQIGWLPARTDSFHVRLVRLLDADRLLLSLTGDNGFAWTTVSSSTNPAILDCLSTVGLRVFKAGVDFDNFVVSSPTTSLLATPARSLVRAKNVADDLMGHWWQGDNISGQILNTHSGYTTNLPDPRGVLWERATLYIVMYNLFQLDRDLTMQQRLQADWQRTKRVFTAKELEACGQESGTNWACDDAGWSVLMYLAAYRVTGDPDALDRAKGLFNNSFSRWYDDQIGGGLWYSDTRTFKSLYQVALTLAAVKIYEATLDTTFLQRALLCYNWMEQRLLRPDGLYWCDYDANGPRGAENPDSINQAGSVSFLGGNMAMGVIHARLFRITSDDLYRQRALRTADALLRRLVDTNGVYINDRDAWADGTFGGEWSREVLSLPGISPRHAIVLNATAEAIVTKDRTSDGFYGGAWDGPADGPDSPWSRVGSKPQQIMVSANSANMVVAAAFVNLGQLDSQKPEIRVASATVREG